MKNLFFYIFCIVIVAYNSIVGYGVWKDRLQMERLSNADPYIMVMSCEINGFFTVNNSRLYMCVYMGNDYAMEK